MEKLKVGALVRKVLSSPVHLHFTEGAPGLKQTAVFGRALRLVEGHGPKILRKPDVVDSRCSRLRPRHRLDGRPTARVRGDLQRADRQAWRRKSRPSSRIRARFGSVVVTTAEEMPVQESLEFIRVDAGPPRPDARAGGRECRLPAADRARAARRIDPPVGAAPRGQRTRTGAGSPNAGDGPIAEIPLEPIDAGPSLVGVVGEHLTHELEGSLMDPRRKPLIIVVGSGGVGKTTLAAAMGAAGGATRRRHPGDDLRPVAAAQRRPRGRGRSARRRDRGRGRRQGQAVGQPSRCPADLSTGSSSATRPDEAARQRILTNRFYDRLSGNLAGVLEYMASERLVRGGSLRVPTPESSSTPLRPGRPLIFSAPPNASSASSTAAPCGSRLNRGSTPTASSRSPPGSGFLGRNVEGFLRPHGRAGAAARHGRVLPGLCAALQRVSASALSRSKSF